eukprot:1161025-Pelagomonas_calceolata.AAC.4
MEINAFRPPFLPELLHDAQLVCAASLKNLAEQLCNCGRAPDDHRSRTLAAFRCDDNDDDDDDGNDDAMPDLAGGLQGTQLVEGSFIRGCASRCKQWHCFAHATSPCSRVLSSTMRQLEITWGQLVPCVKTV